MQSIEQVIPAEGRRFGQLVAGGRDHRVWCGLWAVWGSGRPMPAALVDLLAPSCTCGELDVVELVTWWTDRSYQRTPA